MSKNKALVSASDIGKAAYCPHSLYLSKKLSPESAESHVARQRGTQMHEDLTSKVMNDLDKRCYVATYAFGEDDPVTVSLRAWRDRVLKPTWWGRALVRVYYRSSPWLVKQCRRSPTLARVVKTAVQRISRSVRKVDE